MVEMSNVGGSKILSRGGVLPIFLPVGGPQKSVGYVVVGEGGRRGDIGIKVVIFH